MSAMLPRRFALVRHVDDNGVLGAGDIAFGIEFPDGHVVLRSGPAHPATSSWASLDDMLAMHGRDESTGIQWIDPPSSDLEELSELAGSGRRARRRAAVIDREPTAVAATALADSSANGFSRQLDSADAPTRESAPLPPREPGRHRRASQVDEPV